MRWWFAATLPKAWGLFGLLSLLAIVAVPKLPFPFFTLFGTLESVALSALLAIGPPAAWSRVRERRDTEEQLAPVRNTELLDLGLALFPVIVVLIASLSLEGPRAALVPIIVATGLSLLAGHRSVSGFAALLPTGWLMVSLLAGVRDGITAWWALPLATDPALPLLVLASAILAAGMTVFLVGAHE